MIASVLRSGVSSGGANRCRLLLLLVFVVVNLSFLPSFQVRSTRSLLAFNSASRDEYLLPLVEWALEPLFGFFLGIVSFRASQFCPAFLSVPHFGSPLCWFLGFFERETSWGVPCLNYFRPRPPRLSSHVAVPHVLPGGSYCHHHFHIFVASCKPFPTKTLLGPLHANKRCAILHGSYYTKYWKQSRRETSCSVLNINNEKHVVIYLRRISFRIPLA